MENYDSLLAKPNKPSMEIKRYRTLALEIFKTLNVLNLTYMRDLFYLCSSSTRRPNNIAVVRTNTSKDGTKSLKSLEFFLRTHKRLNFTCTFSKSD